MKKFFLLILFALSIVSCSLNDDNVPNYHYEILPVDSFVVPDTFDFGATHQVKLFYKLPTICHSFRGVYFDKYLNEEVVKRTYWFHMTIPTTQSGVPQITEDIEKIEWHSLATAKHCLVQTYPTIIEVIEAYRLKINEI